MHCGVSPSGIEHVVNNTALNLEFSIAHWAAWAPGLPDQTAWRAQFADSNSVWNSSDEIAPVPELAPMTRRRLNRIGRSALQVAYATHAAYSPCPVIFASRYGDLARSVLLLSALANHESMSPTAFSVSVHNAIGAIFSIERGDTENYSALAAGLDTLPLALVEANALLADGAPAVLLVVYEDPLPEVYSAFADAPQFPYAWACSVLPANPALGIVKLNKQPNFIDTNSTLESLHRAASGAMPADLSVLRFLIGAATTLDANGWRYTRA